jgi:hypothetical protein
MDIYHFFNQTGYDVFNDTAKYQQPWLASSPVSGLYYFADSSARAAFVPYELANVDRGISKNSAASKLTALFSQGVSVTSRDFKFGQTYDTINSLLDSSFSIKSWEVLPIAGEFKSDEVRYFWVWLRALPVVQSAIANLEDGKPKCIDPQSYIVFFFTHGSCE